MSEPKNEHPLRRGAGTIEARSAAGFYLVPALLILSLAAAGFLKPDMFPLIAMLLPWLTVGHGSIVISRTKLKSDALKRTFEALVGPGEDV